MEISIILTVVLIASVLAYLFLPARQHTDIDGNPVSRPPAKQTPVPSSNPVQPAYRRKPARSTPAEPYTFRGTGSLTTAEMRLEEGLYQLTCQLAADRKLTVNLKAVGGESSRPITTTAGLTKHRISIDQGGNYQLEVQCDTPETTWALLVKPL